MDIAPKCAAAGLRREEASICLQLPEQQSFFVFRLFVLVLVFFFHAGTNKVPRKSMNDLSGRRLPAPWESFAV